MISISISITKYIRYGFNSAMSAMRVFIKMMKDERIWKVRVLLLGELASRTLVEAKSFQVLTESVGRLNSKYPYSSDWI